ncbi:hypothetical protein PanWU01x14_316020, partial [Parasponia andersonii]
IRYRLSFSQSCPLSLSLSLSSFLSFSQTHPKPHHHHHHFFCFLFHPCLIFLIPSSPPYLIYLEALISKSISRHLYMGLYLFNNWPLCFITTLSLSFWTRSSYMCFKCMVSSYSSRTPCLTCGAVQDFIFPHNPSLIISVIIIVIIVIIIIIIIIVSNLFYFLYLTSS